MNKYLSTQQRAEKAAKEQNKKTLSNIMWGLGVLMFLCVIAEIAFGSKAFAKEYQYRINPALSQFSYEELKGSLNRVLVSYARATGHTFAPIEQSDLIQPQYPDRLVRFRPAIEFPNNAYALAASGTKIRDNSSVAADPFLLEGVIRHEVGHNFYLTHTTTNPHSIMYINFLASRESRSMLWRADLLELNRRHTPSEQPVGYIEVDEKISVMIPSIELEGVENSVRLRYFPDGEFWLVDKHYVPDDGKDMIEKATLLEGDILELRDVLYMGIEFPLVRMQVDAETGKFTLYEGEEP